MYHQTRKIGISSGHFTRNELSTDQEDSLNQFIQVLQTDMTLNDKEREFCNEACLIRYLVARDWNVSKAHKMLRNTLKWRQEFKPETIQFEDIRKCADSGKIYQLGYDKVGRPLLVMTPARENSKLDNDTNLKFLVYMLEKAIEAMPHDQQQMIWMVDFKGYSRHNALPLNMCMEVLGILSNHYPERLGMAFLLDTPWIFSLLWKAISPFISKSTHQKINFFSGSKAEKLQQFVDTDMLEKKFGGTHNDLDFDTPSLAGLTLEDNEYASNMSVD